MPTPTTETVPAYWAYMRAVLDVLREVTSLKNDDIDRRVAAAMGLSAEILAIPHKPERPDASEVSYRIAWARTYLKKVGLIENAERGDWRITTRGRETRDLDVEQVIATVRAEAARPEGPPEEESPEAPRRDLNEQDTAIDAALATELLSLHREMSAKGEFLAPEQAERGYRNFREQFGPDVLSQLDGESLLTRMHGRGAARNSLVYWLEFKDDEEFPGQFGSIGGGSALKFGIYQAAETGRWMAADRSNTPAPLSLDEAVTRARRQRDQLVAGTRVLSELANASSVDYLTLQQRLVEAAPDLAETSWGHKYFSLLFPTILEPFHGEQTQRHQLIRLLKVPSKGRYANARFMVGFARQLGVSLLDLAALLYRRNGSPYAYWRVGTTLGAQSVWTTMRDGGFMAIGWPALGDLSKLEHGPSGREALRASMERNYPNTPQMVGRLTQQVFNFIAAAEARDVIVAMDGTRVLGVGRLSGDYYCQPDDGPFPHKRKVDWLQPGPEWQLPETEGLQTSFVPLRKPSNLVGIEARMLGGTPTPRRQEAPNGGTTVIERAPAEPPPPLVGTLARIQSVLQRKRQVILYGPPGTGKTYWAEVAVEELAARSWFGVVRDSLTDQQRAELRRDGAIEICSFHPAFGYEDFLEGLRAKETNGSLAFELRPGLFKRLCTRAAQAPSKEFYLIIDEINRGDIPRIFGELLTVLEREKRGKSITLPLSGEAFAVPDNVHVIGTMNTADRSIALLDAALRRRFGFVELLPDSGLLGSATAGGVPLGAWLDELNRRIVQHVGRDARHLQVGHSYLMSNGKPVREFARFAEVLRDDIIPLLEEYCYESIDTLRHILGSKVVGTDRVDTDLFKPERHADLTQAILFEGIATRLEAVTAQAAAQPSSVDDEDQPVADEG